MSIPHDYMERVYAGWLAKIIGIRYGTPIEGWTYERILEKYGEMNGYVQDFINYAADDDSNGPLFYLRALADKTDDGEFAPQDVANALLNYAAYEKGFFWWGGYGISTEHTAYLNLAAGIPAPESGSIALNGKTVAEQIGGQIFIDTWGLVSPGNPAQAARLARCAASVTHDGNGIYGGIFIACAISLAFIEHDIEKIIDGALSYIPQDCLYTEVVNAVRAYHRGHPDSWRDCYQYLKANYGYDKYGGGCHIIPNAGVIILALEYGGGDFDKTLNICNMCGWDTDCNVGNVATIMGVRNGRAAISDKWTSCVNDLLICSGVMGSLNIMDIPYGASYIASLAYRLAGEEMPEPYASVIGDQIDGCHFEYPGSTHAMRHSGANARLRNSEERAHTGRRSLRCDAEGAARIFRRTYYFVHDFSDSRYDPHFSPIFYPGQTLRVFASAETELTLRAYAKDNRSGREWTGDAVSAGSGWTEISVTVPPCDALIDEAGVEVLSEAGGTFWLDDMTYTGTADYTLDFKNETTDIWAWPHREVSQTNLFKGLRYLEDGMLNLSCADRGEINTGRHDWKDGTAEFDITPVAGDHNAVLFRMQGAQRSYAASMEEGRLKLLKNENGVWRELGSVPFNAEHGKPYTVKVEMRMNLYTVEADGVRLTCADPVKPYLEGALGLGVRRGSHIRCSAIRAKLTR